MTPDGQIALLWLGFAGSHLLLSSRALRPRIIAVARERGFQGIYSLVAFAFFVPLVWIYFESIHSGAWLWALPRGAVLTWIVNLGVGLAFVMIVAGAISPSPASIAAPAGEVEPRGMFRITRHPLVMGIGLFGLLHLLPNAATADVAFFGGFAAFALLGCWHQDRRKLVDLGDRYRGFHAATPFLPFTGSGTLRAVRELSPVALVVGVALAVAVRWAHAFWA